jgi:translation initiation factor 2B subunit (eIF-2B alpha/beta/delta family)
MKLPAANIHGIRPRITCTDGTSLSVQASPLHYSDPQTVEGPHRLVEVGYLRDAAGNDLPAPPDWEEHGDVLAPVFNYTPVALVEAFIAQHGGISES